MNIVELFEKHEDKYLNTTDIDTGGMPLDLYAFNLLHKLCPSSYDIVSASEHDEFFLSTPVDKLNSVATEDDVITLIRCGVMYHSQFDCLYMFA